jgi:hypothetical protein
MLQHSVLRSVSVGVPSSLYAGISSYSGKTLNDITVIMMVMTNDNIGKILL